MKKVIRVLAGVLVLTLGLGVGGVWAIVKITVSRDGSSPRTLEIPAGDAVQFINKSGGTAHIWFGENDAVRFLVEKGGSTMKFERPGTYVYTVHVTADKVHSHTGKIVVK